MKALRPIETERLGELLADRALGELSPASAEELSVLLDRAGHPGFEPAVAWLTLALDDPSEGRLPDDLRAELRGLGERLVGPATGAVRRARGARQAGFMETSGWLVAAVWCGLAAWAWTGGRGSEGHGEPEYDTIEAAGDTVIVGLEGAGELADAGPAGEALWNERMQVGYLRLNELPPNNPDRWQYQLWIQDGGRDTTHPVSGGVFDVIPDHRGESIVAFRPGVPVARAERFTVTREPPGGVVTAHRSDAVLAGTPRGASSPPGKLGP